MKKALLLCSTVLLAFVATAQEKQHVTAGVTGALNMSKFSVKARNSSSTNLDYKFHSDGVAGFWINIPLSQRLSFEPQMLFISNSYKPDNATVNDYNGKINYFGIPLLLKIHASKYIAFPVGVQFDMRTSIKTDNNFFDKQDFQSYSFGLTGGIEILPKARVTVFGRYIYGFTTVNNLGNTQRPYDLKNQNIYAGLKIKLFDFDKKKVVPPPPPPPPKDTDGDGIIDSLDKCPTVPGLPKYQGCPIPDTDKDGINDEEDKCPTVPGLPKYQGCPIPDTDGDGINDENDKCPTVPGVPEYQGCPVPDRDKDGVPDKDDKCPDTPGLPELQGCPEISKEVKSTIDYAAKNVYFNTNSTKLLSKSFGPLDSVVAILNRNVNLKLKIDGHTDSDGTDAYNLKLSDGRAASVKAYLVSKGISEDRLESEGFGESMPIAPNTTAAGKAKNRRVEMKVFY